MASSSCPRWRLILLGVLLAVSSVSAANTFDIEKAESGLFRIVNFDLKGNAATGTGFLISDTGLIVTNCHVVDDARTLLVAQRRPDIVKVWSARVVSISGAKDLALLQVADVTGTPMILNKAGAAKGSDVYAIGFPGQADQPGEWDAFEAALRANHFHDLPLSDLYDNFVRSSVKKGNVEDVRMRSWGYPKTQGRIMVVQHSASFTGGNSGGPLLDDENRVVGVNTLTKGEGAYSDASGEKILLGNILRLSSSSTELVTLLDSLHLSYAAEATRPSSTPTLNPSPTPAPSLESAATGTPAFGSPLPAVTQEGPRAGQEWERSDGAGNDARAAASKRHSADSSNYVPWIIGGLLGSALVAAGFILFLLLRFRAPSQLPVGSRPTPESPPRDALRPVAPGPTPGSDSRWVFVGQDIEGHPYRLAFDAAAFSRRSGILLLGRSSARCDLALDHDSLSRVHAELRYRGSALSVLDKGSANGTKVNNRVLQSENDEVNLFPGDKLYVGEITLTLGVDRSA